MASLGGASQLEGTAKEGLNNGHRPSPFEAKQMRGRIAALGAYGRVRHLLGFRLNIKKVPDLCNPDTAAACQEASRLQRKPTIARQGISAPSAEREVAIDITGLQTTTL